MPTDEAALVPLDLPTEDDPHRSEPIEVEGTPGATGWRKGIEAALAAGEQA